MFNNLYPFFHKLSDSLISNQRNVYLLYLLFVYKPEFCSKAEFAKPIEDAKVKEIAAKHKKSPAQVLLRYLIQRDIVVIPKSITPKRIEENFNVFDFSLTADEMKILDNLEINERTFGGEMISLK